MLITFANALSLICLTEDSAKMTKIICLMAHMTAPPTAKQAISMQNL